MFYTGSTVVSPAQKIYRKCRSIAVKHVWLQSNLPSGTSSNPLFGIADVVFGLMHVFLAFVCPDGITVNAALKPRQACDLKTQYTLVHFRIHNVRTSVSMRTIFLHLEIILNRLVQLRS